MNAETIKNVQKLCDQIDGLLGQIEDACVEAVDSSDEPEADDVLYWKENMDEAINAANEAVANIAENVRT